MGSALFAALLIIIPILSLPRAITLYAGTFDIAFILWYITFGIKND